MALIGCGGRGAGAALSAGPGRGGSRLRGARSGSGAAWPAEAGGSRRRLAPLPGPSRWVKERLDV